MPKKTHQERRPWWSPRQHQGQLLESRIDIEMSSRAGQKHRTQSYVRGEEEQGDTMLKKSASWAPSPAVSRSASGQMMQGDLPPSSKVTGLILSAACFMMSLPTSVLPVKATLSMPATQRKDLVSMHCSKTFYVHFCATTSALPVRGTLSMPVRQRTEFGHATAARLSVCTSVLPMQEDNLCRPLWLPAKFTLSVPVSEYADLGHAARLLFECTRSYQTFILELA